MLRRLHPDQPDSFAFTPANQAWAEAQLTKFPEGRQASAIIPLLWRAQEQEGWLTRPAIEHVCDMLGLAHIRGLEVATFYFMFQLAPVGATAHIQVCGTTSCMICGAEDLVAVCKDKIAKRPHQISADGQFSWEEVECLGACANAPMAQIGKDYYEDLTAERMAWIIDEMAAGRVPTPGPQNGRYASEPASGLTSLTEHEAGRDDLNVSARMATDIGETIKRIDGTEVPLVANWGDAGGRSAIPSPLEGERDSMLQPGGHPSAGETPGPKPSENAPVDETGITKQEAREVDAARPEASGPSDPDAPRPTPREGSHATPGTAPATANEPGDAKPHGTSQAPSAPEAEPERLSAPRDGQADDLKRISGVGPKLEGMLNDLGFFHFHQIAEWTPEQIAWVDNRLNFRGRIERDGWIAQAKDFMKDT